MHVGVANGAPDLEVVTGADGERGVKQQVFPAAHPSKREDVRLLAHWLTETLQQLDGNLPHVCILIIHADFCFHDIAWPPALSSPLHLSRLPHASLRLHLLSTE